MNKQTWINIGLLGFIIILASYLLLSEKPDEEELPLVSTIDGNNIDKIEITRKGLDNFSFEKEEADWFMRSPLTFKANNARINAMLRLLKSESHAQLDPGQNPLERFALADPDIIMKLNEYEFRFGNTDAIDQRRYVLFNNTIHLTNDFLYQQLTTNAAFFADTKLLPEGFKINAIQFPDNELNKFDDQWQLQKLMDISPTQLQRLVNSWENAVAVSASVYKAPETESFITVSGADESILKFVIVGTEPHLILGRKDLGIQYHMGSDEADKLLLKENPPIEPAPGLIEPE